MSVVGSLRDDFIEGVKILRRERTALEAGGEVPVGEYATVAPEVRGRLEAPLWVAAGALGGVGELWGAVATSADKPTSAVFLTCAAALFGLSVLQARVVMNVGRSVRQRTAEL